MRLGMLLKYAGNAGGPDMDKVLAADNLDSIRYGRVKAGVWIR